jgi:hypothetical protein
MRESKEPVCGPYRLRKKSSRAARSVSRPPASPTREQMKQAIYISHYYFVELANLFLFGHDLRRAEKAKEDKKS